METVINTLLKVIAFALILSTGTDTALADRFEDGLRLRGIKVAYVDKARPLCFSAPDGELQGLIVDLWRMWSKKTGIPVRFVLTTWKDALQSVLEGRADVFGGLAKNDERERRFAFSRPVFSAETVLIVKAGSGLEKKSFARQGVIGVIRETHAEELHQKLFPEGAIKAYLRSEELLTAFSLGEVDGVATYLPAFYMYNRQLERPVRYEVLCALDKSDVCVAVRKGDGQLLQAIDKGFALISDNERKTIQNRWFVPDPAQDGTGSAWYWICGAFLAAAIALLIFRMTRHPGH